MENRATSSKGNRDAELPLGHFLWFVPIGTGVTLWCESTHGYCPLEEDESFSTNPLLLGSAPLPKIIPGVVVVLLHENEGVLSTSHFEFQRLIYFKNQNYIYKCRQ